MNLETTDETDLELIENLSNHEPEPPTEAEPVEPAAAPEPVEEVNPQEAEIQRLRRVIATDPNLRQAYEAEQYREYGIENPYYPQAQQPQQPTQAQGQQAQPGQQPQLPFSLDDYNPTDPAHQMALFGYLLKQELSPFSQYIDSVQAQEASFQQQQRVQQVNEMDAGLNKALDKYVPGFSEMSPEALTEEQELLVSSFHQLFQKELFAKCPPNRTMNGQPYNPLWEHPKVHQEIISKIGPRVQQRAQKLGLYQPGTQQKGSKALARETYVESSNAVPSNNRNPFEAAYEADDALGMVKALGRIN